MASCVSRASGSPHGRIGLEKARPPSNRSIDDAAITAQLRQVRERDARGRQAPEVLYGRRKMTAWLARSGFPLISKHTVDRLMRDEQMNGLVR